MTPAAIEIIITPSIEDGFDPADPFRYGWRPIRRRGPAGQVSWDRQPLTLQDVLHPREGDVVIQSDLHGICCRYLTDVFESCLAADPTAIVLQDVLIRWDVPGLKPHAPDVTVITGVRRRRRERKSFNVATEGTRPAMIVEVTSASTVALDRLTKLEEYALARVPLYVIVDLVARPRQASPRLLGHTLTADGYRELALDERGWLWLEPVRVWLGSQDDQIICYDEAGRPLGDYRMLAAALAAARQTLAAARQALAAERQAMAAERRARAEAEQRAAAAEARLRALEAERRPPPSPSDL